MNTTSKSSLKPPKKLPVSASAANTSQTKASAPAQDASQHKQKAVLSWNEWRAKTVTDFLAEVKEVVQGKPLFVNILPDPLLAKERFGYDFEAMAQYTDYFVIPMFSKGIPNTLVLGNNRTRLQEQTKEANRSLTSTSAAPTKHGKQSHQPNKS